jgi:hypothetical protein
LVIALVILSLPSFASPHVLTSSPSSPNFASPRTKSTLAEFKVRRTRWCPGKRAGCVERRGRRNGKKGKTSRTETVGDKRGKAGSEVGLRLVIGSAPVVG